MPKLDLPWPTSALPGRRPGEGQGDLVNAFALPRGEIIEYPRLPGLTRRYTLDTSPGNVGRIARGQLVSGSYLLNVWNNQLTAIATNGTITEAAVPIPGNGPVTMAVNLRQPVGEVVICANESVFSLDMNTFAITQHPDSATLGAINSVDYYAGYFIFTAPNGTIWASDLQNQEVTGTSFARAEYASDGLLRGLNNGQTFLAFGETTTEVWQDVGSSPFPMARATVIPVGLAGQWAVAGGPGVWEHGVLFVAADFTVRQLVGYDPKVVSNDDVTNDLQAYRAQPDKIRAQVYTFGQQAIWSVSTPDCTWEYNIATGQWHRRQSHRRKNWRAEYCTRWLGRWYAQTTVGLAGILEVDETAFREDGETYPWQVESGPASSFPASVRIPSVAFDMATGLGRLGFPSPFETDPAVEVSWSHDGGATWANPLSRSMGEEGEFKKLVRVNNLGRSSHHGIRIRLRVTDPVPCRLRAAKATAKAGRAKPVGV